MYIYWLLVDYRTKECIISFHKYQSISEMLKSKTIIEQLIKIQFFVDKVRFLSAINLYNTGWFVNF